MSQERKSVLFFEVFYEGNEYKSRMETAKEFTFRDLDVMIESMSISLTNLIKHRGELSNLKHIGTVESKHPGNFGDGLE